MNELISNYNGISKSLKWDQLSLEQLTGLGSGGSILSRIKQFNQHNLLKNLFTLHFLTCMFLIWLALFKREKNSLTLKRGDYPKNVWESLKILEQKCIGASWENPYVCLSSSAWGHTAWMLCFSTLFHFILSEDCPTPLTPHSAFRGLVVFLSLDGSLSSLVYLLF